MSRNSENGKLGESIAARFLVSGGYSIIERNYRSRLGEIDIIAFRSGVVFFVEVKAVAREMFLGEHAYVARENSPLARIDSRKQKKLKRVIQQYIVTHGTCECGYLALGVYISESDTRAYCESFIEHTL